MEEVSSVSPLGLAPALAPPRPFRSITYGALLTCLWAWGPATGAEREELKVCADPHNLPFSNMEEQGFENRIAELLAEDLGGIPVKYEWFPQRMGFIRNTLRAEVTTGVYKCDIVMGVPDGFELAAPTAPYYVSVYALVYARGRGMDEVRKPEDLAELPEESRKRIRFGVFDRGPAQLWVFKQGLMDRAVPYRAQHGDARVSPGSIVQDVIDGKIDATIIWGPFAGYYAKQRAGDAELVVLPLRSDRENPQMKFEYSISMAVRYGEKEWKARVNRFIEERRDDIHAILAEFGVPLLEAEPARQVPPDS